MFPLRDNIPASSTPFVNYTIIGICSVLWLLQLSEKDQLIDQLAMIPARVLNSNAVVELPVKQEIIVDRNGRPVRAADGRVKVQIITRKADPPLVPGWATMLTCVFLHGSWLHIIGNMWFLWVFGDNVEDRLGHVGYVIFYLGCGVAASLSHYLTAMNSMIPTVGASGAIAGVMGAYLLFYPKARVLTLVPIFFIIQIIVIPAPIFLGIWFVLQLYSGTAAITAAETTGVAWWAHIGGFAVGAAYAWIMKQTHIARPAVERIRPGTDRTVYYQGAPFRVRDRRDVGRD
ncbi:rhomboid family intramembrane serine protease [Calycomorphotria hydatis]|uniref:Rhomboid family protein n=1 Tax=Calycomorphotria hydatis TaxID=2528027 RepID=A0A517T547_9PLAN|nr:rhomboid family intramembrane serine protease [Calycomorphotria hydatis]QDT63461.1 Rhomboid family protein [Calycomorphotria hydatis]